MNRSSHLPHADRAFVSDRKLVDYLLATEHPFGRAKARFFLSLGFRREAVAELREALRRHAAENAVATIEETEFGSKYVIDGPLFGPGGRKAGTRTVWFTETGEEAPRLVTAYPWKGATE